MHAINAELLALQGNTAAAAAITRADSEFLFRRKLTASGYTGTAAELDRADRIKHAQEQLTDVTTRYSNVVQQLGLNQALVDLQYAAGSITELDSYAKKADAARQMIPILNAQAASYEAIGAAIAKAGGDPSKFLLAAQGMRLEIAKLAVDADGLAKKFNDIGSGAFATFLTDIVNRTKPAKQALLDMFKSIEQSISQIAAKNVAEQLFGKGGPLGGLGSMFARAFGDKGAGGVGTDAALAAAGTSLNTSGAALLVAATALDASAAALAASAAASGASGIGGQFFGSGSGGLDSIIGPGGLFDFAEGTDYVSRTGLAFVHQGEAIISAAQNKPGSRVAAGGFHVHQTINVLPGASRETAEQAAVRTAAEVRRATRKFG